MALWYRTFPTMNVFIEKVIVSRFTDCYVWLEDGRQAQRCGSTVEYWQTWPEAHRRVIQILEERVALARRDLEYAKGRLISAMSMQEPKNE